MAVKRLPDDDTGWVVYIVESTQGTLYTGITTCLERRLREHASGRGARYFRFAGPARVRYQEQVADRSAAQVREAAIKRCTRAAKLALIARASGRP